MINRPLYIENNKIKRGKIMNNNITKDNNKTLCLGGENGGTQGVFLKTNAPKASRRQRSADSVQHTVNSF